MKGKAKNHTYGYDGTAYKKDGFFMLCRKTAHTEMIEYIKDHKHQTKTKHKK